MGAYISSLWNPDLPTDIVVDFDRIESPTGAELELFKAASELLEHARMVVTVVQGYQGCGDLIREATRNPHDEAIQIQTFEGMFPNVERIKSFWLLSKDIDDVAVRLVKNFIETRTFTPALLKVFASLLDVTLRFDREKMMHPEIQNDFSQYRRALQRNQRIPGVPLNDIEANNVSMFVAPASPLINSLSSALDNLQRQGKDVAVFLADFAHICCAFVMRDKSQNKEHAMLTLTAMVVAFILYDSISPVGVFGKGSHIDVKTCVGQLRAITDAHNRGILCDTLHYSTRSYDKAPDSIKRIIETR